MHYGTEATLSHTGETQTPYHTGITHAHENVPEHRLVHTHHCGRLGAMLIAFFCFLRKDNFTVNKVDAFNSRKHLCRGDVAFGKTDVTFTFRHSKTNQFHAPRVHRTKAVSIAGHPLDPIQALVALMALMAP